MFVRNFLFVTSEPSTESCGHDVYVCICVYVYVCVWGTSENLTNFPVCLPTPFHLTVHSLEEITVT